MIESTPSSVSSAMSISIISGSYPVLAASTASTVSVAFSDDTPGGAADGDGAAGGGADTAAAATPPPCERISLSIASTTSPTVCVRESAATSCASTLSCFCTSLRISTRLIESTPSSVSSAMSISIISGSYPVLAASTASTVSVAFSDDTPGAAPSPSAAPPGVSSEKATETVL